MTAYLQFDQVCKFFPGVKALNGVSFSAHAGQVHGLLGENGAGKSTLLKILGGQYKPDGGRLLVGGTERHFTSAELVASMLPGTSRVFRAENRMWSFGMPASSSALTEPSVRFLPVSSSL